MALQVKKYNVLDLQKDKAVGIKLPLNSKEGGVFVQSYTTEDQAISNLKNLLLTRKGERLYHSNFGSAIYDVLFEQNTDDVISLLDKTLRMDISYWLPYIIIENLDIQPKLDGELGSHGHGIVIKFYFRVTEQGANRAITFVILESGKAFIE